MFQKALTRSNNSRPPIWFMRQAGRYLPSYQDLRKKYTLSELFFTPELAKEVTLQPIRELGFDAAILFSDITVVAKPLGLPLDFVDGIGPVVSSHEIKRSPVRESLFCVTETIRLIRSELKVPLIGFCGGPFTVAHYLLPRESLFDHSFLQCITDVTLEYLDLQIDAGVEAIQIFDSWADLISIEQQRIYCFPYHEQLIRKAQARKIPVISFFRHATQHAHELAQMAPDAISFDAQKPLSEMRRLFPSLVLQGNLDPDLLFSSFSDIEKKTREILDSMRGDPGFIFNLSHGVKPGTPWKAVRHLISIVKNYGC